MLLLISQLLLLVTVSSKNLQRAVAYTSCTWHDLEEGKLYNWATFPSTYQL